MSTPIMDLFFFFFFFPFFEGTPIMDLVGSLEGH